MSFGAYNTAGLPNLSGYGDFVVESGETDAATGMWVKQIEAQNTAMQTITSAGRTVATFSLDASRSNSEYGAQSTVMPASADMAVGIYLGRSA